MTAAAGVALSHVLGRGGRTRFSRLIRRGKIGGADGATLTLRGNRRRYSFRCRMHGCMSHTRGTPGFAAPVRHLHYLAKTGLPGRRLS